MSLLGPLDVAQRALEQLARIAQQRPGEVSRIRRRQAQPTGNPVDRLGRQGRRLDETPRPVEVRVHLEARDAGRYAFQQIVSGLRESSSCVRCRAVVGESREECGQPGQVCRDVPRDRLQIVVAVLLRS